MRSIPNLTDNQENLEKILNLLIDRILKNRPDIKLSKADREGLVKNMVDIIKTSHEANPIKTVDLLKPEFVSKLSIVLVQAMTLDKNTGYDNLKKLFKQNGITKADDLKKIPKPELKKLVNEMYLDLLKNLKQSKLGLEIEKSISKEEKADREVLANKLTEDFFEQPDPLAAVFGLMNPTQGGMAIPVFTILYTNNIPDLSPNYGGTTFPPIERINNLNDTQYGDPLNLNEMTKTNYFEMGSGDDNFITNFIQELTENGLAPSTAPKFTPTGR